MWAERNGAFPVEAKRTRPGSFFLSGRFAAASFVSSAFEFAPLPLGEVDARSASGEGRMPDIVRSQR